MSVFIPCIWVRKQTQRDYVAAYSKSEEPVLGPSPLISQDWGSFDNTSGFQIAEPIFTWNSICSIPPILLYVFHILTSKMVSVS